MACEGTPPSQNSTEVVLFQTASSLSEKIQSIDMTSREVDTVVDEIGDVLTRWNRDFHKLKPHEVISLSDHIERSPDVLKSFISLADNVLLSKTDLYNYCKN